MTWSEGERAVLSDIGEQRREAILRAAERALVARGVRAQRIRIAGTAGALALVVGGGVLLTRGLAVAPAGPAGVGGTGTSVAAAGGGDDREVGAGPGADVAGDAALAGAAGGERVTAEVERERIVMTARFTDDASVVERLSTAARPVRTVRIDDFELMALLEEAGLGDGLIRTGGRVILASEVRSSGADTGDPGQG